MWLFSVLALLSADTATWRAYPHTFAAHLTRGAYETPAHVRFLGREVAGAIDDGVQLLIVEGPPRHGKSLQFAQWVPTWFLANHPDKHVGIGSYAADLAQSHGRIVRNNIAEYGPQLGVSLAGDSTAVNRWHTDAGGSCTSVGVGGAATGFGWHLIVLDDVVKDAEEADSEVMRAKVIEWFQSVIWTRREPGALVIVMMTRWHEGDLIGWLLSHPVLSKMARHVRLPAIAEADDVLGRKPGEALWEGRIGLTMLNEIKAALSPRWWEALYMQRPTAAEGAEIKRSWWRYYDELPVTWEDLEYRLASWDATFTDADASDFVVGIVFGVFGGQRYVLDMVRQRMTFTETCAAIAKTHQRWQCHGTAVELAANGQAIVNTLQGAIPGLYGVKVGSNGKVARARATSPQIQAGNVLLPKGQKWADELVEEHAAFPLGKHDDTVDAMSQGLSELAQFQGVPVSHLRPGDNRFVSPDILEIQKRVGMGNVFRAPRSWKL
jgi:predicted phage terminase large subunit-like protein